MESFYYFKATTSNKHKDASFQARMVESVTDTRIFLKHIYSLTVTEDALWPVTLLGRTPITNVNSVVQLHPHQNRWETLSNIV